MLKKEPLELINEVEENSEIDEIILIGGATRLPIIRKFVGKIFGRLPNTSVNPDEAVAIGAALQAAMKERDQYI